MSSAFSNVERLTRNHKPTRLRVEGRKGPSFVDQRETDIDDVNIRFISECYVNWRAGLAKLVHVHFSEPTVIPRCESSDFMARASADSSESKEVESAYHPNGGRALDITAWVPSKSRYRNTPRGSFPFIISTKYVRRLKQPLHP